MKIEILPNYENLSLFASGKEKNISVISLLRMLFPNLTIYMTYDDNYQINLNLLYDSNYLILKAIDFNLFERDSIEDLKDGFIHLYETIKEWYLSIKHKSSVFELDIIK